jgi:hypothetical protein
MLIKSNTKINISNKFSKLKRLSQKMKEPLKPDKHDKIKLKLT